MEPSSEEQRGFRAVLERGDRALGWTVASVPFDPRQVWPAMIRTRVCGEVTGPAGSVGFRSSLFPKPGGGSFLLLPRKLQQEAGLALGDAADFTLRPDFDDRPAELPDALDALLDEAEGLRHWYNELSQSMRRELGKWIQQPKQDETRVRRAGQMAERLLSAMEAEAELPPLIERAFRTRPKSRVGWERMTPTQRRGELLAVFLYQSPEAREKRVAKLVDGAEKRAE